MSLSVILTCYNETPAIFDAFEKIARMLDAEKIDHEIIVVDDGSRPEVQRELEAYFKDKNGVNLILSRTNEGRGAAVTKGIKVSSKEYAGFIDTDLEISESSLLDLYREITSSHFDMVIGKRIYLFSWNTKHWLRTAASRLYRLIANSFLKLGFLDTETGVKLFKRKKIATFVDCLDDKRWFWDTEIVAESLRCGLKVGQLPVLVSQKIKKSSVHVLRDTKRYLTALYRYRQKQGRAK